MDYVTLGDTGLKISRLCLGTMTYGAPGWRDWVLPEDESRPLIERALEIALGEDEIVRLEEPYDTGDSTNRLAWRSNATQAYAPFGAARGRACRRAHVSAHALAGMSPTRCWGTAEAERDETVMTGPRPRRPTEAFPKIGVRNLFPRFFAISIKKGS